MTQSRFFISLLVHVMSIRQSLVCLRFFSRQLAEKCCFQIADNFTTETSFIIIKF